MLKPQYNRKVDFSFVSFALSIIVEHSTHVPKINSSTRPIFHQSLKAKTVNLLLNSWIPKRVTWSIGQAVACCSCIVTLVWHKMVGCRSSNFKRRQYHLQLFHLKLQQHRHQMFQLKDYNLTLFGMCRCCGFGTFWTHAPWRHAAMPPYHYFLKYFVLIPIWHFTDHLPYIRGIYRWLVLDLGDLANLKWSWS